MVCEIFAAGVLRKYKYVVTLSICEGRVMLSRHRARTTWESQGGHVEAGESAIEAAKRELYEESGAVEYDIVPLCDYRVGEANGAVFVAHIHKLGVLPESEIAEVRFFDGLPENLTYPQITPYLYAEAVRQGMA